MRAHRLSPGPTLYDDGGLGTVRGGLAVVALLVALHLAGAAAFTGPVWLAAPALLLAVVALRQLRPRIARVDLDLELDGVRVVSRLGSSRFVRRDELGVPRVDAPRLVVPVRGGRPLRLDLTAHIPDVEAFRAVFPVHRSHFE